MTKSISDRKMGSSRFLEDELHRHQVSPNEELGLFLEMQKKDRSRNDTRAAPRRSSSVAVAAEANHEYLGSFEEGPLSAGSAMEAHVAARLASSSLYRSSKPIMRYASKRNNADLLTFDVGKTDYDWLMTPPATPLFDSLDNPVESGNFLVQPQILTTGYEAKSKFSSQRPELVVVSRLDHMALSWENLATSTPSLLSPGNLANTIENINTHILSSGYNNSSKDQSPHHDVVVSPHATSNSSAKSSEKSFPTPATNSQSAPKQSLRSKTPISRSSAVPPVATVNATSSTSKSSSKTITTSKSSASTAPRMGVTANNAKQSTISSTTSRGPTSSQSETKGTASNAGKSRSTSIGRGAINMNKSTNGVGSTNKLSKGSKSTSTSRAGSPETNPKTRPLLWEPSEMLGFSIEAPPNLRTTTSKRSMSTSRGSKQPTTPTSNNNIIGSNNSNIGVKSTGRSTSASKGRSTSTVNTRSNGSDNDATAVATSKVGNSKGASNNNVLGSRMVDKVIQSRRAASSSSSSSPPSLSSSSALSSLPSKSSSLVTSSTSSLVQGKSNDLITMPREPKSQLQHTKNSAKQSASSTRPLTVAASLFKDTAPISNPTRFYQSSKTKPTQGMGDAHRSAVSIAPAVGSHVRPLNNTTNLENTMRNIGLGRSKKADTLSSMLLRNDYNMKEEKQQQHLVNHYMSEESSDFSNELNAIMRQDRNQYNGPFPSKDIIKVNNNWMMNSPDYMRDDSVEFMHLFRQGIEKYGVSESPLVCQHGAAGNCDKCNNVAMKSLRNTREVWKASPHSGNMRVSLQNPGDIWKGSPF